MIFLWKFYDFFMIFLWKIYDIFMFFYDFFEGGAGRKNHKNIIKWVIKKS